MTNAMWKKFFNFIKNAMKKGGDMALANRPLRAILLTSLFAVLGVLDAYNAKYLVGSEELISLEAWLGGLLAFWGVLLLARRTANQDKQLAIQINKEIDDRFIAAVTLLGSRESSARTGAVYSLYHLAIESEKYRKQIAQILCSHIRFKTQEKDYRVEHKDAPSNEIQTIIDILFRDVNGVKGLYCHVFAKQKEFPKPNLSRAYLCGGNFTEAGCYGADFSFSQCLLANFFNSGFQSANFESARLWGAEFQFTCCQGASFMNSECWKVDFTKAGLQGANFECAQCYGADFTDADCQGGNFDKTAFQSAKFKDTNFEGAYSRITHFLSLESRIGKPTEVKAAIFGGEFSLDRLLENAFEGMGEDSFYSYFEYVMRRIEEKHKGERLSYVIPDGVITGVLGDDAEIRFYAERIKEAE